MRLDLACGQNLTEGFVGVDKYLLPRTDGGHIVIQADLLVFPWPFDSETVDEAVCHHFVEHIPMTDTAGGQDMLCAFMDELYRVMKPGATVTITYPHPHSDRAFQDPTHRRFIPWQTWAYFDLEYRQLKGLTHYLINANFEFMGYDLHGVSDAAIEMPEEGRDMAIDRLWNMVADVRVGLRKKAAPEPPTA